MKLSYSRRYRGNPSNSKESAASKKDNQHEQAFFSAPSNESFFKPHTAIQRKCDHCEAEDKQVKRMSATKEEEKKVSKKEDDKELHRQMTNKENDKEIHKTGDKKEEEKKVHLKSEKDEKEKKLQKMSTSHEEEKKVTKMSDKKEEKELHGATDHQEEDKKLSKKEAAPSDTNAASASAYIHSLNGKGHSLPEDAQHFFGEKMDHDFANVKIHTGTEAEQSAKAVNAKAYTVDNHIVFNKGQYNPNSQDGKKLLAHELTHVVQNNQAGSLNRKTQNIEEQKEKNITITGSATKAKSKKAHGSCEGVDVHGQTDFNPLPSSFAVHGTTRSSTACEECTPPECITSQGTIVSTFRSNITVTLPAVPDGLSRCESDAVRRFIRTTLKPHEQQHVAAFRTYNGTVRTRYNYTGCRSGLEEHIQSVHNDLDSQRSASAIAQSDALDPFVRSIPCNCQ